MPTRLDIKNSPFTAVLIDNEWTITMGNFIMTSKKFKKHEDAINYVKTKAWDLIMNATATYLYLIKKNDNKIKEEENGNN